VQREDVLATARAAFAERGFEGTTLTAIASRLGVTPAALLRHAPNKEALFKAAMDEEPQTVPLPMLFLERTRGDADPQLVLRRLAETFVPFAEARIGESIVRWQREAQAGATIGLALPPQHAAGPRRGIAIVERYFRRAKRAGRMKMADPQAAALAFMASLQSYVFLHRVARIFDPPLPLARYIDTLIEIWTDGALRPAEPSGRRTRKRDL